MSFIIEEVPNSGVAFLKRCGIHMYIQKFSLLVS